CYEWLKFCRLEDKYRDTTRISHWVKICIDHFADDMFKVLPNYKVRLEHHAVPTIHADGTVVPYTPRPPSPVSRLGISLSPERRYNFKEFIASTLRVSPERTGVSFHRDKVVRTYSKKKRSSPYSTRDSCGVKDSQPACSPEIAVCPRLTTFPKEPEDTTLQDSCGAKDHQLVSSAEILACPRLTTFPKEPEHSTLQESCRVKKHQPMSSPEIVVCPGVASVVKESVDTTSQDTLLTITTHCMDEEDPLALPEIKSEPSEMKSEIKVELEEWNEIQPDLERYFHTV
ncbi:hypothetical protein L9F63_003335, partial [Diploptera punctata]